MKKNILPKKKYTIAIALFTFFYINFIESNDQPKITIMVASYNNETWVQQNLDSIFSQDCDQFHLIYIDDCSSDNTFKLAEEYIVKHNKTSSSTLIKNSYRRGACANYYQAAHLCDDDDILLFVDGDDCLENNHVIKEIIEVYKTHGVWITYGQFKTTSGYIYRHASIPESVIINNNIRNHPWITSHLKTCYAWLFKKIKLKDLFFRGKFLESASDLGFMFPMIEMAGTHSRCIDKVLYIYNDMTQQNDFTINRGIQLSMDSYLRKKKKYKSLNKPIKKKVKRTYIDCIILSSNIGKTDNLIKTLNRYCSSLDINYVLDINNKNLSKKILKKVLLSTSDYVLIIDDSYIIKSEIDFAECIAILEQTFASAFYLDRDIADAPNNLIYEEIIHKNNSIVAWQFDINDNTWNNPYSSGAAMYKQNTLIKKLINKNKLASTKKNNNIGLCFKKKPISSQ